VPIAPSDRRGVLEPASRLKKSLAFIRSFFL
jgi:hypothetical protein